MHDGYATVNTESIGDLFVEIVEMAANFIAELRNPHDIILVSDGEAQYISGVETRRLVHALVKERVLVGVLYIQYLTRRGDMP